MALVPVVPGLTVRPVDNSSELLSARRLHAQCYLKNEYITEADLDHDGLLQDDWVPFSDYFVAIDDDRNEIVGTCRLIKPSVRGFPCFQHFELSPEAMSVFRDLDPNRCVEISALATRRNGMQNMAISGALYGAIWQRAIEIRRAYLLAIVDDRLHRLAKSFLEIPLEPIGEPKYFMGARTTPTAVYVPRAVAEVERDNLEFFSGSIPFAELNEIALDLRRSVPEFTQTVVGIRPTGT